MINKKSYLVRQNWWSVIFVIPAVLIFLVWYIWPMFLAIGTSFTKWNGFNGAQFIGFANYIELFKDDNFRQATLNTFYWALLGIFIHVPCGVILALILSRKMKGWRFVRSVYMLPNIISGAGLGLLFLFIYKPGAGILNAFLNLLGFNINRNWLMDPSTAFISVVCMWLFYAAVITLITLSELLSVSPSIHESARIDGANEFEIDLYLNLPMIKRIVGTGIIVTVMSTFKTFDIIYITTSGGPGNKTLNLAVMMVNNVIRQSRYGYANAIGVILMILGIIVMLINTHLFSMNKEE